MSGRNGDHDDLEWPMLSYYVIYCEKFRTILQRTEKVALNVAQLYVCHIWGTFNEANQNNVDIYVFLNNLYKPHTS